ncbi:MAG: cold shock domain-containing protein [bacterium]
MQTGTIKRLTDRGFGFIAIEGNDKDLFFHSNELKGVTFEELKEGDKVQFEITGSDKGDNATNVSRADASAPAEEAEATDAPAAE